MPTIHDASKTIGMWLIAVFGIVLVLGSGVLVYLGATGDSRIWLFGRPFSYESVGFVGLFLGAIITFLSLRRGFRLLDTMVQKGKRGVG